MTPVLALLEFRSFVVNSLGRVALVTGFIQRAAADIGETGGRHIVLFV